MSGDLLMVALGYHGSDFHGSQIQRDVRTVQGEMTKALRQLDWWSDGCLEISSRTDAGVSVRMNLAAISLSESVLLNVGEATFVRAINDHLPVDLVVWQAQRVSGESIVRFASSRTYLYRCEMIPKWPQEFDNDLFVAACAAFVGKHDFSNFCRLEDNRSPLRTVDSVEPWRDTSGRIVGISVTAESFLWNQIRRIASAIHRVILSEISVDDIVSALANPEVPVDHGRAPADGLILWSLDHPDFSQHIDSTPLVEGFSLPPIGSRAHRRWLNLARMENSTLLEHEWIKLNQGGG
ncbi:MAG: hypothetical protein QGI58_01855 [Candidatus Thalassarchaeaceae archaeon]|nr:hypothetical protein [Candidatus Thalassarchaeaceae archaeon]